MLIAETSVRQRPHRDPDSDWIAAAWRLCGDWRQSASGSIGLLRNALAAAHVGTAVIDGVNRDQLSVLAVFDREAPLRRIADGLRIVIALAQARHLELKLVLIRPEPRHGIISLRLAEDR